MEDPRVMHVWVVADLFLEIRSAFVGRLATNCRCTVVKTACPGTTNKRRRASVASSRPRLRRPVDRGALVLPNIAGFHGCLATLRAALKRFNCDISQRFEQLSDGSQSLAEVHDWSEVSFYSLDSSSSGRPVFGSHRSSQMRVKTRGGSSSAVYSRCSASSSFTSIRDGARVAS